MLALTALAIYPVIEEVLSSAGFVLQLFRRYSPGWVAVLGSTLFFAVTHIGGGLQNVIFALVTGLVFSWLVLRTSRLGQSVYPVPCDGESGLPIRIQPSFRRPRLFQPR